MKIKSTLLSVVVLGFYLFYALFPLLYSVENAQAEEQTGNLPGLSIQASQHCFVDQSLLSAASPKQDDDSSPASSARVLLKKKRAVPASFKSIIETLSLCEVKLFECTPSSDITKISTIITDDRPVCPHGFQLCHSGISPPSV
ncbi:MAG TPA: hypothetical protein VLG39_02725 [Nitrospirota bacterium]|nr:hypothetical protein [Nitrospirota bacterium]